MGKGARLRAQRESKPTFEEKDAPIPVHVDKPSIAKAKRHRRRAAFRQWRTLPVPVKRAAEAEALKMAAEQNEETK